MYVPSAVVAEQLIKGRKVSNYPHLKYETTEI